MALTLFFKRHNLEATSSEGPNALALERPRYSGHPVRKIDAQYSHRFRTVLRGRYREFRRKNAARCEGLRIANQAAKLLTDQNFRDFRHGTERIFPSWTSWVRIPSPAVSPHD